MRLTHLATAFLSTLSLRRATTWGSPTPTPTKKFLSTLSLRRATSYSDRSQSQPIFLSTLSLRRATIHGKLSTMHHGYFYPRSPCGERPTPIGIMSASILNFYPRSPCGERHTQLRQAITAEQFLSTLSLRRATLRRSASIWLDRYFYPRSPCGERLTL
mgnify:CR=1 FL=1